MNKSELKILQDGTSGKTPVHITVEKRDPALLKILLKACPSAANATMYNDNRPLHSAATLSGVTEQQQLDLVKVLLEFGADKAARNKANKLPVELVKQGREKVMMKFHYIGDSGCFTHQQLYTIKTHLMEKAWRVN